MLLIWLRGDFLFSTLFDDLGNFVFVLLVGLDIMSYLIEFSHHPCHVLPLSCSSPSGKCSSSFIYNILSLGRTGLGWTEGERMIQRFVLTSSRSDVETASTSGSRANRCSLCSHFATSARSGADDGLWCATWKRFHVVLMIETTIGT